MACWKTRPKVHVAGVPLSSSVRRETVGLSSFRIDVVVGVVVVVWKGGTICASSSLRANEECFSQWCTSSPAWKRGPLAPVVVVVGEGQVNLVYDGRVVAMGKVSKALWLMIWILMMNQIDLRLRFQLLYDSGTRMSSTAGLQDL